MLRGQDVQPMVSETNNDAQNSTMYGSFVVLPIHRSKKKKLNRLQRKRHRCVNNRVLSLTKTTRTPLVHENAAKS